MTRNTWMALGLSVAFAAAAPAAADAQGRFNGLDRNRDGVVTRGEWRGNDTSFRNQDRNGDGVLSGAELNRRSRAIVPIWWGQDANRDGRVSRGEWLGVFIDFDLLDRNDDGWLSRDEVSNARSARSGDRGRASQDPGRNTAPKVNKAKPSKGKPAKPGKPGGGRGRGHGRG